MNKKIILSGVISGIVAGSIFYMFTLLSQVAMLQGQIKIMELSGRIAGDQISDLSYQLREQRMAAEFAGTREFVSGAVDALKRPEYYAEIWHSGYDRGSQVEQYAKSLDLDKAYTKESSGE